jgi:hypothetical protein
MALKAFDSGESDFWVTLGLFSHYPLEGNSPVRKGGVPDQNK